MLATATDREFLETATNPGSLKTLRLSKVADKLARKHLK